MFFSFFSAYLFINEISSKPSDCWIHKPLPTNPTISWYMLLHINVKCSIHLVFPWFSHGFPLVFPWFSHGFPMVFPWFPRPVFANGNGQERPAHRAHWHGGLEAAGAGAGLRGRQGGDGQNLWDLGEVEGLGWDGMGWDDGEIMIVILIYFNSVLDDGWWDGMMLR